MALGLRRNRLEKQLRGFGDLALEGGNEGQEARIINTLVFDVGNWVDEGAEWECSRAGREEAQ